MPPALRRDMRGSIRALLAALPAGEAVRAMRRLTDRAAECSRDRCASGARRMTRLFALHSAYGLATAAAGIDQGLFEESDERVLVPFDSARVPETTVGIDAQPQLASLRARCDRIESLDALLQPRHPSSWEPDDDELPVLRRLLERAWRFDDDLELCVQSPQVAPAPRAHVAVP